ncbi:MAG: queuosine precursor transporter [Candidatus Kaiserbacteria bacterium]|nr:MAG: queuosine precursor transporter [Candidatus Kaiserbacteria bacterium]
MPHFDAAQKKVLIALTIYLASLFAANTLGLKIAPFILGFHVSVAVFSFPFVFLTTDVIGEIYGKPMARFFVRCGFLATALFLLYSLISISLPWAEAGLWAKESYEQIFGVSMRIALASLVAFAVAEFQDVHAFFFVKKKIGEKLFWLRSLLSNVWSQFLDSALFMLIAFYGVYSNAALLRIIITWWLFKVMMGLLYTPLSYLALKLLREKPAA